MEFFKLEDELEYYSKRYKLSREIEDMFLHKGYVKMDPLTFEDYEKFVSINKRVKKESVVKVFSDNLKVLRPDITTSIIKHLMPKGRNGLKAKIFYNSVIFKNKKFNIEEIRQIGIEYLGEESFEAELEVIGLAINILKRSGRKNILEIGSSKYINSLLNELNIEDEKKGELKTLINRKNQYEIRIFLEEEHISHAIYELLSNMLTLQGTLEEVINRAKQYYLNEDMKDALQELIQLNEFICNEGEDENILFDLSMIREFDYYEGVIFKGYIEGYFKDILRGGRYDALTKTFGKKVPAIGFSVDLDELINFINEGGEDSGVCNNCSV